MKTQESGNLRKGDKVLAEKLIDNDFVMFDLEADSSEEVIRKMADVMEQNDRLIDKETYVADVLQREKVSGTAVGFSVATPHAKSEGVPLYLFKQKIPSLTYFPLMYILP